MLKVHNFWSLCGAIIICIIIANFLRRGSTTISLFGGFQQFFVNTIKALEVKTE